MEAALAEHIDDDYIDDIFFEDEYLDDLTEEENDTLKYGYTCLFSERAPVNNDIANCQSQESALLFHIEKENLKIPYHLFFRNLQQDIPKKHHKRIANAWSKVVKHKRRMDSAARLLRKTWKKPPKINNKKAKRTKENTPLEIGESFRKGALAIISKPRDQKRTSKKEELQDWHTQERGTRRELYYDFRNYLLSLRAYYEMLLEHDSEQKQYILPKNHKYREEVAKRNRYLRVLHAFHAVAEGAKAAHHEQGKKRVRKGEKVPFVAHSMRTAAAGIYDLAPHILENQENINIGLITLTTAWLIHDILEDTDLSIDQIIEKVVRGPIDTIDSSLMQKIKPGFKSEFIEKAQKMKDEDGNPLDENAIERKANELYQEKVIKLINTTREQALRQILRILSNNNPLNEKQKKKACQNNIAGGDKILTLLDINDQDLKRWGLMKEFELSDPDLTGETITDKNLKKGPTTVSIPMISNIPRSRTFEDWTEEYDNGKSARFLLRLTSIVDSEAKRRLALWVKLHDRADNIETQQNMSTGLQLSNLRTATTRILSWCINDHNNEKYPLYNSVYRLITVCIKEYERLQKEKPNWLEDDIDGPIIEQLKKWEEEIEPLQMPMHFQKVIDDFDKKQTAIKKKDDKARRRKQWLNKWSGGLLYSSAA